MGEPLTPRRILMTADGTSGIFAHAVELGRALGELDVEVVLAVMGRALTSAQHGEANGVPTLRVVEQPYKLEWMDEPWADIARARAWLLELEREHAPDVVQLHGFSYASAAFRAPKLIVAHGCMPSWWQALHGEPASAALSRFRENIRQGLLAADSVIAPTQALLAELERFRGLGAVGSVIPYGIDLSRVEHADKESFVLSASACDEAPNFLGLARVAPRLAWPVYVAGDAERTASAAAAGVELVQTLGPLTPSELAEWLGRAAIYAQPARHMSFGLTILEAAARGCALVLGDIPSLRELWDGAAEFVPPDDEEALSTTLTHIIESPTVRGALAEAATERARRYDLTQSRDAYLRHYRDMLQRAQGGTGVAPRSGVAPAAKARPALRPGPLGNTGGRRERG